MATQPPIMGTFKRAPNLAEFLAHIGATDTASAAPLIISRSDRAWLGELIETLIRVLDHADGDADCEHDDLDRCTAGEDGPAIATALDLLWKDAA